MKKVMLSLMIFCSGQAILSSEFDDFKVPSSWTDDDVVNNLKRRNSKLNQYLNWHQERDEFMKTSHGSVQTQMRDSDEYQAREALRQLKKSLHVE